MEDFTNSFDRYITFVDQTRDEIQMMLARLRENTLSGGLGDKFDALVRADMQKQVASLHEEFISDLRQLRKDVEYVRSLDASNPHF